MVMIKTICPILTMPGFLEKVAAAIHHYLGSYPLEFAHREEGRKRWLQPYVETPKGSEVLGAIPGD